MKLLAQVFMWMWILQAFLVKCQSDLIHDLTAINQAVCGLGCLHSKHPLDDYMGGSCRKTVFVCRAVVSQINLWNARLYVSLWCCFFLWCLSMSLRSISDSAWRAHAFHSCLQLFGNPSFLATVLGGSLFSEWQTSQDTISTAPWASCRMRKPWVVRSYASLAGWGPQKNGCLRFLETCVTEYCLLFSKPALLSGYLWQLSVVLRYTKDRPWPVTTDFQGLQVWGTVHQGFGSQIW